MNITAIKEKEGNWKPSIIYSTSYSTHYMIDCQFSAIASRRPILVMNRITFQTAVLILAFLAACRRRRSYRRLFLNLRIHLKFKLTMTLLSWFISKSNDCRRDFLIKAYNNLPYISLYFPRTQSPASGSTFLRTIYKTANCFDESCLLLAKTVPHNHLHYIVR